MNCLRAVFCLFALTSFGSIGLNAQAVTSAGLRSSAGKGSFKAAQYTPDGSLLLLLDQGDGLRLLKTDATGRITTAQAHVGAAGDTGVALTLDPGGNIYVAGTSTSGALVGTPGVVFPSAADTSTNSFLAKFDSQLNLVFLTFLGTGKTEAAGIAATADAVFVGGVTYSAALPATSATFQTRPAEGSEANGFAERFTTDGSALAYATYLTGSSGDTVPSSLAADTADHLYLVGETSAAGFPTTAFALQPRILGATSGFVTELTSDGAGTPFSTFIPGTGLTSIVIDRATNTLLVSGNVSLGQFPVATVSTPIANTAYQSLLRLSEDGQTLLNSMLLGPAQASFVTAAPGGSAWISGTLGYSPWLGSVSSGPSLGDAFLLHISQADIIDTSLRFSGEPSANASYASLTSTVAAPTISPDGSTATLPGTIAAAVSASLAPTQRFDLPLTATPNPVLPSAVADMLAAPCSGTAQCTFTAGLLATVSPPSGSGTTLSLSTDTLPDLTLRNAGQATASGLVITAAGYSAATNCGTTLEPSAQCGIALTGAGPGSLSVSAANAPALRVPLPANTITTNALALSTAELDFGIVTASSPVSRTVTISNLSSTAQTFTSTPDASPGNPPYGFAEIASTCGDAPAAHTVAANSSCAVTLQLSASTSASNDGPVSAAWKLGPRDVFITGITQAASLSVSAAEIDFGVQFAGVTPALPRYLYLSNSSGTPIPHQAVSLPPNSPFSVSDVCPTVLAASSVCRIGITYTPSNAPSEDTATLTLDGGLDVLITGAALPGAAATGIGTNPSLSVSAGSVLFAQPVIVTAISSEVQPVTVTNTGGTTQPFSATVSGDFLLTNHCGLAISPGSECVLLLQFAPSQPGTRQGLLSVSGVSGFAPMYVSVAGTAGALLAPNNGTLNVGQTFVGQPEVAWYKVQASLTTLTASVSSASFGLALVPDLNGGHATLPTSAFAPTVTAACPNCWLGVQFQTETTGSAQSTLTLSSLVGGNPYPLAVTANAVPVAGAILTPSTQDFGAVPLGSTSAPVVFTFVNLVSPAAPITVQNVTATGDFSVVQNATGGPSCTGTLASTASCYIEVAFSPSTSGPRSGTLTVNTASGPIVTSLTGNSAAAAALTISPSSLVFTDQPGQAATQNALTLTNSSTASLNIGAITSSGPSLSVTGSCGILAAGSSCTVQVTFTPANALSAGTLSIPSSSTAGGQASTTVYTVPIAGQYTSSNVGLLLLPADANFGVQATGALGLAREFTVVNTSNQVAAVAISAPHHFPLSTPFPCATVAPGASCTFSASFLPEAGGALTGSLVASAILPSGANATAISYVRGYANGAQALGLSPIPSPGSAFSFGQVTSGATGQQSFTLANVGTGVLNIRRITASPPFFASSNCGAPLSSTSSCMVSITYAPGYQVATEDAAALPRTDVGVLTIESDATSSPNQVELSGTVLPTIAGSTASPALVASYTLSTGALTFPNTQPGQSSSPLVLSLLNTGNAPLHFGNVLASADFQSTTNCLTLQPNQTCTVAVTFSPGAASSAAVRSGTLQIPSNASDPLEFVSLLGLSSPAPLMLSPGTVNFGDVNLGATSEMGITVTDTAPLAVVLGQLAISGDYTLDPGTCPSSSAPLPAGQSCTLAVTFAPAATGTRSGTLTVSTSSQPSTPITLDLQGTGTQPSGFSLQVNGTGSGSATITAGASATYPLTLTPTGGYTGPVTLTCTAITAAPESLCSVLNSQLTLGSTAQQTTATISTDESNPASGSSALLLLGPLLLYRKRRRPSRLPRARLLSFCAIGIALAGSITGCSRPGSNGQPLTPPGTYQYKVTATSTTGPLVASSVTLNVSVQ